MKSNNWKWLATLVLAFFAGLTQAIAQAPAVVAPPTATNAAAPAPAPTSVVAPNAAINAVSEPANPAAQPAELTAPVLLPGSTAKPGWNVPQPWDKVQSVPQYASVPGHEANVLEQDQGQWWRTMRNGPVTFYGGIILLVVPTILLIFFAIKGPFRLHDKPTGRLIERFNSAERMVHWTLAFSFVALALTGLTILFGKHVLMPVIGASSFAFLTTIGKNVHNFVGPLFTFSLVVFFILYVKDNIFKNRDFAWLAKLGGLMSGHHVPSGRFNAGEKIWFWLSIVMLGIAVSTSGVIMLFPNWNATRELMTDANLVHAILSTLFVAASLGHIYIGTIGTEGALQGMKTGSVDETWAREHHALWLEEVQSAKRAGAAMGAAQPAAGDD